MRLTDAAGQVKDVALSGSATAAPTDTTAPTVPQGLTATVPAGTTGQTQINLSWTASTDNVGVTKYDVFEGTTLVKTVTTTSTSITGLTANTSHTYTVK